MNSIVCCKNSSVGKGESILASENATRSVFTYKSLVGGNGIKLSSTPNEITISRLDSNIFLEENYNDMVFNTEVNIILAHNTTLSGCTFNSKSNISGYGTIKNCTFLDETNINVHKLHYTVDSKFHNSYIKADTIIIEKCTLRNISHIKCNELLMNSASIIASELFIETYNMECKDSIINANCTIDSYILDIVSYTSPTFMCNILKINSKYITCIAKLCNAKNVDIICSTFKSKHTDHIIANSVKLTCDIVGSLDINANMLSVHSNTVDLSSSKWNITDGNVHLIINKLICNKLTINTNNCCVMCNIFDANITGKLLFILGGNGSMIKMEKMITDDTLLELSDTNCTSLGGDWFTSADNLVKVGPNNVDIKLLPSFLKSSKSPFLASEFIKIRTLPTVSNKSSICVSHIPPQNFSVVN